MPSINGFDVVPYGSDKLATYTVPGSNVKLSVRKEVAPLLIGFAADFHRVVETLNVGKDDWGHAPRKIAGSDSWSFHAPGIAMDLNSSAHPMGKRGTFTAAEVSAIRGLLKKWSYGGKPIFRWGGDYKSKADEMHFEIIIPRDAALLAVKYLQTTPPTTPPTKGWTEMLIEQLPVVQQGSQDEFSVKLVQGALVAQGYDIKIDGDFGDKTKAAVIAAQKRYGAEDVDGAVGRETWPILLLRKDVW